MDDIFRNILERDPESIVVLLRGEHPPAKSLKLRLQEKLGSLSERIMFLSTLGKQDAHLLLQSVDCCLDSHPLCGMSSSFDGAMLGVPIVTLPASVPFGRWTAAIYEYIGVSDLTAKDKEDYVNIALRLASDKMWHQEKSREIAGKAACYVESRKSSLEFQEFIVQSWNRKTAGLPVTNWISGQWN
jgi:predicted O-linked N-acetylglucosamine transferase (SPINDLY family)